MKRGNKFSLGWVLKVILHLDEKITIFVLVLLIFFFFWYLVDYRHSETSATALMIASGRGFLSQVEQLISMGASIHCKSSNGW